MSFGFEWDFGSIVAALSVAIPMLAFVWEFVVVRRKRLGYRVQMDTLATDTAHAPNADVLARMHEDGRPLTEPSFVLLRVENAGLTEIVEGDYLTPQNDWTGIRVTFRDRRVVGLAVTELSQPELRDFFIAQVDGVTTEAEGFGISEEDGAGVIRLPKVKLNTGAHYKVLAVLERSSGNPGDRFSKPVFRADVAGRSNRWVRWVSRLKLARTESHTFASRPALVGIALLTTAVLVQSSIALFWRQSPPPLDCVGGTLRLHGSTAFAPAVSEAAGKYAELCGGKGAAVPLGPGTFRGSTEGVNALERAGEGAGISGGAGLGDHIAFTDGRAIGDHPRLLARPIAYSLFTLVVNEDAGVQNLSLQQVRDIYAEKITNWSEVGGASVPVNLVNRHRGSGTRTALEERVLSSEGGPRTEVPEATVGDCSALGRDEPGGCEVGDTETLLREVADVPGALGHSEASGAATADDVVQVRIDGIPATLSGVEDGRYPYWQIEFAYTYGEPPADSIAAAFLRYLTDQGGKDVLREFGDRPCSETRFPLLCEPA
ncbi:substrate-binding domain-containing protein [Actinomadura algeriensis]|uniref:ABC-type phosphate transport system substrate-binding protein n=1 Tax=Actinomadura algeriensis TaxID=1679523 RepID=A0ABR9JTN6_9ACTN|nr:substrate-binding domain-containing protein [Actinomadura algeriensis]MBE1533927.1 ABC-type phosphate transport system substrate-binding protein [Actinomadura algeriensis]